MVVAAVLVIGIVITGCGPPAEYWHTPVAQGDSKIEFVITATESYSDVALPVLRFC